MAKKTNTSTTAAETQKRVHFIGNVKECLSNLRRFLFVSDRIFSTLKTSRKEMMSKEIENLQKLISEL